ncbi:hypothetical protein QQS21_001361 [Conoideocrella luteorostrata]|uniref:Uncharacterized protein n=1 Tax=Conoideocrella luteorostrata TaxID=1105319 RepID=A0AAJ0CZW8_9HYPO|nr:hypothetical protein QQS21_001361 [Conoideocrella luteorostrata]
MDISEDTFTALVARGKAKYDHLVTSVQRNGYNFKSLPNIIPRYHTRMELPSSPSISEREVEALHDTGYLNDEFVLIFVCNSGATDAVPPYQNYIDASGKSMLCCYNYAEKDRFNGQSEQIFWSDLMAVCYHTVMRQHGQSTKNLETVWRISIKNEITKGVIKRFVSKPRSVKYFELGTEFFALLGTVNGSGVARMLATYPQMFGRRIIARVGVFRHNADQSALCWHLEPAPEPVPKIAPVLPSSPSRKQLRRHKKSLSKGLASEDFSRDFV